MPEWSTAGPFELDERQRAALAQACKAASLGERLRIVPGFDGVRIVSTSFVGRVDVGPLCIAVNPKLAQAPLARLLRYAYGIDDLSPLPSESTLDIEPMGLQDLIVELLLREIALIRASGWPKAYQRRTDELAALRGRLRKEVLSRRGVVLDARLPCEFHERTPDWHLNQVLRGGLTLARTLCQRLALRRQLDRCLGELDAVRVITSLDHAQLERAEAGLTRMTRHVAPALTLIRLLLDGAGIGFEAGVTARGPSFLFDMNRFFQHLVSRFLHDHLPHHLVADEQALRGMYSAEPGGRPRRPPAPRPDFAVLAPDPERGTFLDAKYKDLWASSLSAEWLYQLTIYALASPSRSASIIYPTMSAHARSEVIRVTDPHSRNGLGRVLLRPLPLPELGELVLDPSPGAVARKRDLAAQLALPADDAQLRAAA